ncbi:hypothetical protein PANT_18d00103 [Moesziomyces antarcticus T-34]|uniref:Uncharacterized protein n=1 Tax=Pseudozyma antarctica (strain T-34) TaxID=1151754 RepID=M9LYH9_PSEA3|nr:hypothetical protein PANT_18d00103 [Moesziomyces antarcticus T-34]
MSSSLQKRAGNRALRTNPPNANIHLGRWGSDWGYVVFCVMAASLIGLLIWSTKLARKRRTFHYLFIPVLAISSVAWYSMASDLGATPVTVQFRHNSPLGPGSRYPTRQIWFARYIDWTLTTSLLLLSLLLITALPLSVIFITLFFNVLMIVCGLLGALTPTRYKWAYFVFACAALGYVLYHVFAMGLRSARRLGGGFGRAYLTGASLLAVIWPMYAICWGLSEGGNVIGVSEEVRRASFQHDKASLFIFYGLLDIVSKPLFVFLLLGMLRDCDYGALRLRSGKITESRIEESDRDRDRDHAPETRQPEQAKAFEGPTQPGAESGLAPADNQYPASQHRPRSHTSTRPEPTSYLIDQNFPFEEPKDKDIVYIGSNVNLPISLVTFSINDTRTDEEVAADKEYLLRHDDMTYTEIVSDTQVLEDFYVEAINLLVHAYNHADFDKLKEIRRYLKHRQFDCWPAQGLTFTKISKTLAVKLAEAFA